MPLHLNCITSIKSKFVTYSQHSLLALLCGLPILTEAHSPVKVGDMQTVDIEYRSQVLDQMPAITSLNEGGYIVLWTAEISGNSYIYGQRYDQNNVKIGHPTRINTNAKRASRAPHILPLTDGKLLVTWQNYWVRSINGRKLNHDGSFASSEFELTPITAPVNNYNRRAAALKNGWFIIGWGDRDRQTPVVYARAFSPSGIPFDQRIDIISSNEKLYRENPSLIASDDNSFVLTWAASSNIYVRRFDANHKPLGQEFRINREGLTNGKDTDIQHLPNGGFLVVWRGFDVHSDSYGIHGQRFNADGSVAGENFTLVQNTSSSTHTQPKITVLDSGALVVTWTAPDADGLGVFAQAFNQNGDKLGDAFQVNDTAKGSQKLPNLTALSNEQFAISWLSSPNNNDEWTVHIQKYQLPSGPKNSVIPTLPTGPIYEGDTISLNLDVQGSHIYGIEAIITVNAPKKASFSGGHHGSFIPENERLDTPLQYSDARWEASATLVPPHKAKTGEGQFATATLLAKQMGEVSLRIETKFTGEDGSLMFEHSAAHSLTIYESVILTGNIKTLTENADYQDITLTYNTQPVAINPDGSFYIQAQLTPGLLTISSPGFLTAKAEYHFKTGQKDIHFGEIVLIPGDVNQDNAINIADFTLFMSHYRSHASEPTYLSIADFNKDGQINIKDLTLLGKHFGKFGDQPINP